MVVGKDGRLNVSIAVCVCTGYQLIDSNDVRIHIFGSHVESDMGFADRDTCSHTL